MKKLIALLGSFVLLGSNAFAMSTMVMETKQYYKAPTAMETYQQKIWENRISKLENMLIKALEKTMQKNISLISDTQTQEIISIKYDSIIQDISSHFMMLKYSYDKESRQNHLQEIKAIINNKFRSLESEISVIIAGNNPYIVPAQDKAKVENLSLEFQKDLISYIKKDLFMDYLSSQGLSETGNIMISVNSMFGSIKLEMPKYSSKIDFVNGSQEMDMQLNIDLDLNIPMGYESQKIKGKIFLDMNIKMIGTDTYIMLRDYKISGDSQELNNQIMMISPMIQMYKNKTLKMPSNMNDMHGETMMMTNSNGLIILKGILDILENNPLFTAYKKDGDKLYVFWKLETLDKMMKIVDPSEDVSMNANADILSSEKLYYKNNSINIDINEPDSGIGNIKFYMDNGFQIKVQIDGTGFDIGNKFYMTMSKGVGKLEFIVPDLKIISDWANKQMNMDIDFGTNKINVSGSTAIENTNLNITYNGSNIGHIKSSYVGNNADYDMMINLDSLKTFEEFFTNLVMQMSGKASVSTGSVVIDTPTDYIDISEMMMKSME